MTGSLTAKHGKYYVVVRVPDDTGGVKAKWIPTGIPSEGNNKRKAQQKRLEILAELEQNKTLIQEDMLFSDWLKEWMKIKAPSIAPDTAEYYQLCIDKHIRPYFDKRKLTVKNITARDIQNYYSVKLSEGQSANSVHKHRSIISGALKEAKRKKLIRENPVADATLPKKEQFSGKAYSLDDALRLEAALDGETIKPAVILGLYYGLRRSEVLGLRWRDIDFDAGIMRICNTVVRFKTVIEAEHTKNDASCRTMPLVPETVPYLKELKAEHEALKERIGSRQWDKDGHVCVHKNGKQFSPDYVSHGFSSLLKKHGLPKVRFHDLRHTVGSLLLESGVSVKHIQVYLGHKNISTTLDIYTHLSAAGKAETAKAVGGILKKT